MSTSLTYLAAQQHINDLLHEADRRRQVEDRPRRPVRLAAPRLLARLVHRTTTA
jgi:hypothetical protein